MRRSFQLSSQNLALTACVVLTVAATPATRPAGLRYHFEGNPTAWDADARTRISRAVSEAITIYNANGVFETDIGVLYSPQTPTADANYNGHIRFGGQIGTRTALHEIAHILGVGTHPDWGKHVANGRWTGSRAVAQLKAFDGPNAVLHADRQHFWPYGLNYDREGTTPEQFRRHVLMVIALRADLGLEPATRPEG